MSRVFVQINRNRWLIIFKCDHEASLTLIRNNLLNEKGWKITFYEEVLSVDFIAMSTWFRETLKMYVIAVVCDRDKRSEAGSFCDWENSASKGDVCLLERAWKRGTVFALKAWRFCLWISREGWGSLKENEILEKSKVRLRKGHGFVPWLRSFKLKLFD